MLTALGLRVTVAETDPVRALQALFAGHAVAPLAEVVQDADLVMSATGVADTIDLRALRSCADGTVVAVAGGVEHEVALDDARAAGAERTVVGPKAERLVFPGRDDGPIVLDGGGCINITAAEATRSRSWTCPSPHSSVPSGCSSNAATSSTAPSCRSTPRSTTRPPAWRSPRSERRPRLQGPLAEHPADREPDVRTHRFGDPA